MQPYQPIIDIHSHILPGVDDGSRTEEESISLLREAYAQGIRAVFATPHCFRRRENINPVELVKKLQGRVDAEIGGMKLYPGHETFYHEGLPGQLLSGEAKTLAGTKHVLVEFDPSVSAGTLLRGLRRITDAGYLPVLAHVERYPAIRPQMDDLLGTGSLLQMNYDSLSGNPFSREVRWCRRQVLEGNITFLGTDMHRLDFRPPQITAAVGWLRRHTKPGHFEALVYGNAMDLIREAGNP